MNIETLVADFSEKFEILFRPASPADIGQAEESGIPPSLINFYRDYDPTESGKLDIRFYSLDLVVANLTDFTPCCHLAKFGYFAFAGTRSGDSFYIRDGTDISKMPVYQFSHEFEYEKMKQPQIEEFSITVASGIPDFLKKAVTGEISAD